MNNAVGRLLRLRLQPSPSQPSPGDAEWTEEQLRRLFQDLYPVPAQLHERVWRRLQLRQRNPR